MMTTENHENVDVYLDTNLLVRFALSLGMLLGMSHGWVTADALQQQPMQGLDSIETVNSATQFNPFSSRSHQFFPY